MLRSRRKKIRFQLPPSDNELWAIGVVAVQWSQVETFMVGFVHAMVPETSPDRKSFDETYSFETRCEQWKNLIRDRIKEPSATQLSEVVRRVRNAQQMRDRIMHASWSGKLTKDNEDLSSKGVLNWSKPRSPFDWDIDFGKLMHVINTILVDLLSVTGWAQLSAARPAQAVLLSDALRQIMK